MPTRRIGDAPPTAIWQPKDLCTSPEHYAPIHAMLEPGLYEHECPMCHEKFTFTVAAVPSS